MMRISRAIVHSLLLSLLLFAPSGFAEPVPVPEAMQNRAGLDFEYYNRPASTNAVGRNVFVWEARLQMELTRSLFVDASLPWAYDQPLAKAGERVRAPITPPNDPAGRALLGVPAVGLHYAARMDPTLGYFVGFRLGVPVSATPSEEKEVALEAAAAVRGNQDRYRFSTRRVPLLLAGGVELFEGPLFARVDLAPSIHIRLKTDCPAGIVTGDCAAPMVAIYLDQSTTLGVRHPIGIQGGLRVQESFVLTEAADHMQFAVEPFFGYVSPSRVGAFARVGVLFAVDNDGNLSRGGAPVSEERRVTLRLSAGAKF